METERAPAVEAKAEAQPKLGAGDRDLAQGLYRQMLLIRRFEEAAGKAYQLGKIGGFCHLYIGQEAVAVGAIAALEPTDCVVAGYREHGQALAKGVTAKEVMAELFGKRTGASRGLGGSMHVFSAEKRFLGGYGIVGGQVPLAAGVGFASNYKGSKEVALCFFGDGSSHIGATFEAMHLAQLWRLPVVFVCENNLYAMGTPLSLQSATEDISLRAEGVGMLRDRFDGDDPLVVRERVGRAIQRARGERRPTFIEVITYRFRGHSMADPQKYRTKEEVEAHTREADPIALFRRRLEAEAGVEARWFEEVEADVKREVDEAVRFADESGPPTLDDVTGTVYA